MTTQDSEAPLGKTAVSRPENFSDITRRLPVTRLIFFEEDLKGMKLNELRRGDQDRKAWQHAEQRERERESSSRISSAVGLSSGPYTLVLGGLPLDCITYITNIT